MQFHYFAIYKPFNVLCQFTGEKDQLTLASLGNFPPDVYPVGRLDMDSEGLLILTNDKNLNDFLLHPTQKKEKEYWVQVEGIPSPESIKALQKGVKIRIDKKEHQCLPAKVKIVEEEPQVEERNPPIRFRKTVPTSWLSISITEGKNRQVRRMTAAVGLPTLRLIRTRIANLRIDGMKVGEIKILSPQDIIQGLGYTSKRF